MIDTFTLHVRLTKSCNADCSYCSSWQENPANRMTISDFKESLDFIWLKWADKDINPEYLTIEYVGGEILLVPYPELEAIVLYARSFFKSKGINIKDGVQSNLIGSERRLASIFNLFNGRIGTSIDNTTKKRTIGGSRDSYIEIFKKSEHYLKQNYSKVVPGVFTLDNESIEGLASEIALAKKQMRDLTIRPVFKGGMDDVNFVSSENLAYAMTASFNSWFMKSQIKLEPHFALLKKYISIIEKRNDNDASDLCPFQNNCVKRSLSLEPNGDLFVCQELGDIGKYPLGNSIFRAWNEESWETLAARPENLDEACKTCKYLAVCQGGCMMQAIQDGKGPYGRPDYCYSWKAIFKSIEDGIQEVGLIKVKRWIQRIS